jgi:hypothetical protein
MASPPCAEQLRRGLVAKALIGAGAAGVNTSLLLLSRQP